ncbi:MAG: dTDP-4-dehydrorhamnose reductase [Patescibacteria group bacterium]
MKILLLGKNGLLAQAIFSAFQGHHQVIPFSKAQCDITNTPQLRDVLTETNPDLVINATGYTRVDDAEKNKDEAFAINADAVKELTNLLEPKGTPLVHFSTDYVFDGTNAAGYEEDAKQNPISVYGQSKAAGEAAILNTLKKFYLVRTAWLYGPRGKNFVDNILDAAARGEPLKVVSDQVGNPTFTPDLAQAVLRLLKGNSYGIYHIVNEGSCSWYEFTQEIFHQLGIPQKIEPISSAQLARPAPRPAYSILKNTKLTPLRSWKTALESYLSTKTIII